MKAKAGFGIGRPFCVWSDAWFHWVSLWLHIRVNGGGEQSCRSRFSAFTAQLQDVEKKQGQDEILRHVYKGFGIKFLFIDYQIIEMHDVELFQMIPITDNYLLLLADTKMILNF